MPVPSNSAIQYEMDKGNHDSYFSKLHSHIISLKEAGDRIGVIENLSILGRNLVWSGEVKLGHAKQTEADLLSCELTLPPEIKREVQRNWVETYIAIGRYQTALATVNVVGPGESSYENMAFYRLSSMAFAGLGDTPEALASSQKHLIIAKQHRSERDIARAYRNMAHRIIMDSANIDVSSARDEDICEKIAKARHHAKSADNIDVCSAIDLTETLHFVAIGELSKALELAKKGYSETQSVGYAYRSMMFAYSLAEIEGRRGNFEFAIPWAHKALRIAIADGNPFCYSSQLNKLHKLLDELGAEIPSFEQDPEDCINLPAEQSVHRNYDRNHKVMSALASGQGFRLYNKNLGWHKDSEFFTIFQEFSPAAKTINDRKFALYSIAKYASYLAGDTAECGVLEGASSFLICSANADKSGDFWHHCFDSFEGLSTPIENDKPVVDTARPWQAGELAVDEVKAKNNLSKFGFVKIYKGWIPERFYEVQDRYFSLVHIDVDFYNPTLASLEFFYERTLPGGFIICDDYGFENCAGAKIAFDEFIANKPEKQVIHLPTGQGLIIKF